MLVSEENVSCPILLHLESESFLSNCSFCLWNIFDDVLMNKTNMIFLLEFRMAQNRQKKRKHLVLTILVDIHPEFPTKTPSVHGTFKPPCRLLLDFCHRFNSHIGLGFGSAKKNPWKTSGAKGAVFGWTKVWARIFRMPLLFTNSLLGIFRSFKPDSPRCTSPKFNPWSITCYWIVQERYRSRTRLGIKKIEGFKNNDAFLVF